MGQLLAVGLSRVANYGKLAGAARCFAVYAIVANYGVLAPPVIR